MCPGGETLEKRAAAPMSWHGLLPAIFSAALPDGVQRSFNSGISGIARKASIMLKKSLSLGIIIALAIWAGIVSGTRAAQTTGEAIAIDSDDLAGTVTGASGPEAGVWVIAETTDL